jgi:hypothetical protein
MAAPIDIKAELNLQLLNGINQILFHGWPYTAPGVEYPGWRFYAAAVFNEKNPWWIVMPDITKYLQRCSFLLRQGQPADDVALYLPEPDAFAGFTPGRVSMTEALRPLVRDTVPALLDSGHNLDFVDDGILDQHGTVANGTLVFGDLKYNVVVLPNIQRIPLATMEKFAAFSDSGGLLIATGQLPSVVPGVLATADDQAKLAALVQRLFQGPDAKGVFLPDPTGLGPAIAKKLRADVAYTVVRPEMGFVHRQTAAADIYFVVNTSNQPVSDTAIFRVTGAQPEWWNPLTGTASPATVAMRYADGTAVPVNLPAYGSTFLVFTHRQLPTPPAAPAALPAALDLSKDWTVTFKNANPATADPAPVQLDDLRSWNELPGMQYFSGTGTYDKDVTVPAELLQPGLTVNLDFGPGAPMDESEGRPQNGMRAYYTPSVREGAEVFVNGQRAGAAWCPPYTVDVTSLLKPGVNHLEIVAANLATNDMAEPDHWEPDYAALDQKYGNRFSAQGMDLIESFPSGLLGPVKLVAAAAP